MAKLHFLKKGEVTRKTGVPSIVKNKLLLPLQISLLTNTLLLLVVLKLCLRN